MLVFADYYGQLIVDVPDYHRPCERILWTLSSTILDHGRIIWVWPYDILYHQVKPFGLTLPSTLELILPSTLGKDCMDLEEIIWIMQTIWGPPWWWVMIGKGGQCEMRRGKTTQLLQWWPLSTHYRHLSALSSVGVIRFTSMLAHTDATLTGS